MLRKAALSGFSPRSLLALGPRRFCAAYCSLGTAALLVVSGDGNQLQMCTPLWRRRMGPEKACGHWPQHPTFRQLGRDPARADLTKGTKLASGSCLRESETLLGKPSSAPMRLCSGKQRFLVSPLALACHRNEEGQGFLLLRVHWWFAGHRYSWKPTPNVLYFREKADGA